MKVDLEEKWAKHYNYSNYHKILLVGEGDFSFSASLVAAFGSASNLTATSLNSRKVLRKDYEKAVYNIEELKGKGGKVMYGVDATTMASHPIFKGLAFD
ncbi:PREDICTED: heavy metal-associated isoprenylated plant protein 41-like isoform X2 [Ipomoea nil]|uniref:heavy metal-associated isoprenylated plant protein 41-like isoform X2 n=1 Tax=Ipomoea nil TaxID=35883 RepID=UPI00090152C9|nr:PREDICTED: heavy metal-associated isoprenylated plant protein 41-like isoform X2 [Ipomoea nil]